jgi:hypothetical protein
MNNHHIHKDVIQTNTTTIIPNTTTTSTLPVDNITIHTEKDVKLVPIVENKTVVHKTDTFKGLPDCKKCHGAGFVESRLRKGHMKQCKVCAVATGTCLRCSGTGFKHSNPNKVCHCRK